MELILGPSFSGVKSAYKIKKKQLNSTNENPTKLDHLGSSRVKNVLEDLNAKRKPTQVLNGKLKLSFLNN